MLDKEEVSWRKNFQQCWGESGKLDSKIASSAKKMRAKSFLAGKRTENSQQCVRAGKIFLTLTATRDESDGLSDEWVF